jgi:hypothetical protein
VGFSVIFLSQALQQLSISLEPRIEVQVANVVQLAMEILCLCVWGLLLRREDAVAAVSFQAPPVRDEEVVLLDQLAAFEKLLSRTGRR